MDVLLETSSTFAISLLKLLGQDDPSRNVFFSPLSISSALGMVHLGAKGSTAAQILEALSMDFMVVSPTYFQILLNQVNRPRALYSLNIANRIFSADNCQILSSFQESCQKFYQAELEQLPFAKDPEKSRKHINAWVSSKTEGKIEELLPENSVDESCGLVLINAIYFKGRWEEPFEKSSTREMPFKINQKEQRPVQMMFQKNNLLWAHMSEVGAQVLDLPYEGQELSMVVLLPDEGVDLSTVEKALTFEKFQTWSNLDNMWSTEVQVFLPRFKLQEDYDMVSVLQQMGMVDAFHPGKADLSGMLVDSGLCVSKFVHKSLVEVNEDETEAAAASDCDISCDSFSTVKVFCADHPFLFFIRHRRNNSLLFCGRFSSP